MIREEEKNFPIYRYYPGKSYSYYLYYFSYCIKGEASLKKARGNLLVYERVETHHLSITKKNDPRRVLEDRKTRGILARESLLISKQRIE